MGTLRRLLRTTEWTSATQDFARCLRSAGHGAGGLLLLGTPEEEPWHLAAHLSAEAWACGTPELSPLLIRHVVPAGAPAHLSAGLDRLRMAGRGQTLFVVTAGGSPERMLEHIGDARCRGATVLAVEAGDDDVRSLAHEALTVCDSPASGIRAVDTRTLVTRGHLAADSASEMAFDLAQHLITVAAERTRRQHARRSA
jgi:hypothetical protein